MVRPRGAVLLLRRTERAVRPDSGRQGEGGSARSWSLAQLSSAETQVRGAPPATRPPRLPERAACGGPGPGTWWMGCLNVRQGSV